MKQKRKNLVSSLLAVSAKGDWVRRQGCGQSACSALFELVETRGGSKTARRVQASEDEESSFCESLAGQRGSNAVRSNGEKAHSASRAQNEKERRKRPEVTKKGDERTRHDAELPPSNRRGDRKSRRRSPQVPSPPSRAPLPHFSPPTSSPPLPCFSLSSPSSSSPTWCPASSSAPSRSPQLPLTCLASASSPFLSPSSPLLRSPAASDSFVVTVVSVLQEPLFRLPFFALSCQTSSLARQRDESSQTTQDCNNESGTGDSGDTRNARRREDGQKGFSARESDAASEEVRRDADAQTNAEKSAAACLDADGDLILQRPAASGGRSTSEKGGGLTKKSVSAALALCKQATSESPGSVERQPPPPRVLTRLSSSSASSSSSPFAPLSSDFTPRAVPLSADASSSVLSSCAGPSPPRLSSACARASFVSPRRLLGSPFIVCRRASATSVALVSQQLWTGGLLLANFLFDFFLTQSPRALAASNSPAVAQRDCRWAGRVREFEGEGEGQAAAEAADRGAEVAKNRTEAASASPLTILELGSGVGLLGAALPSILGAVDRLRGAENEAASAPSSPLQCSETRASPTAKSPSFRSLRAIPQAASAHLPQPAAALYPPSPSAFSCQICSPASLRPSPAESGSPPAPSCGSCASRAEGKRETSQNCMQFGGQQPEGVPRGSEASRRKVKLFLTDAEAGALSLAAASLWLNGGEPRGEETAAGEEPHQSERARKFQGEEAKTTGKEGRRKRGEKSGGATAKGEEDGDTTRKERAGDECVDRKERATAQLPPAEKEIPSEKGAVDPSLEIVQQVWRRGGRLSLPCSESPLLSFACAEPDRSPSPCLSQSCCGCCAAPSPSRLPSRLSVSLPGAALATRFSFPASPAAAQSDVEVVLRQLCWGRPPPLRQSSGSGRAAIAAGAAVGREGPRRRWAARRDKTRGASRGEKSAGGGSLSGAAHEERRRRKGAQPDEREGMGSRDEGRPRRFRWNAEEWFSLFPGQAEGLEQTDVGARRNGKAAAKRNRDGGNGGGNGGPSHAAPTTQGDSKRRRGDSEGKEATGRDRETEADPVRVTGASPASPSSSPSKAVKTPKAAMATRRRNCEGAEERRGAAADGDLQQERQSVRRGSTRDEEKGDLLILAADVLYDYKSCDAFAAQVASLLRHHTQARAAGASRPRASLVASRVCSFPEEPIASVPRAADAGEDRAEGAPASPEVRGSAEAEGDAKVASEFRSVRCFLCHTRRVGISCVTSAVPVDVFAEYFRERFVRDVILAGEGDSDGGDGRTAAGPHEQDARERGEHAAETGTGGGRSPRPEKQTPKLREAAEGVVARGKPVGASSQSADDRKDSLEAGAWCEHETRGDAEDGGASGGRRHARGCRQQCRPHRAAFGCLRSSPSLSTPSDDADTGLGPPPWFDLVLHRPPPIRIVPLSSVLLHGEDTESCGAGSHRSGSGSAPGSPLDGRRPSQTGSEGHSGSGAAEEAEVSTHGYRQSAPRRRERDTDAAPDRKARGSVAGGGAAKTEEKGQETRHVSPSTTDGDSEAAAVDSVVHMKEISLGSPRKGVQPRPTESEAALERSRWSHRGHTRQCKVGTVSSELDPFLLGTSAFQHSAAAALQPILPHRLRALMGSHGQRTSSDRQRLPADAGTSRCTWNYFENEPCCRGLTATLRAAARASHEKTGSKASSRDYGAERELCSQGLARAGSNSVATEELRGALSDYGRTYEQSLSSGILSGNAMGKDVSLSASDGSVMTVKSAVPGNRQKYIPTHKCSAEGGEIPASSAAEGLLFEALKMAEVWELCWCATNKKGGIRRRAG
ncbi:hypothetical protein BESB_081800 [Besnoitia besnoiti]|uniref:Methyltransferase n=1 Tax=Besnoitia besnoiti TaxID=94643 RepID=A0A2A9M9I6_BESBE|nr:hypothetical protein BESB_081800 [Besnoitia besnoiti]PFH32981.1 hypothetical protein BESB_081800 [Besnoitia besnoiti]